MYLQNKYTNWYNNIVSHARSRHNINEYLENHHIIPKSLGGTNEETNLVKLTPKEHFICHMLLPKMTFGTNKSKMIRAAWMIATMGNKHQKRIKVNSRTYCSLKEAWIKVTKTKGPMSEETKNKLRKPKSEEHKRKLSETRKGKKFGYTHSEETKNKISVANKGKIGIPKTEEQKQKQSLAIKGRKQSQDHILKRSQTRIGKPLSEETKQKIRDARSKQVISEETKKKMSASHKARRLNTI